MIEFYEDFRRTTASDGIVYCRECVRRVTLIKEICRSANELRGVIPPGLGYPWADRGHTLGHHLSCAWAEEKLRELMQPPILRPFVKPSTAQRALEL